MNPDPTERSLTNSDPHERARFMIALSGSEEVPPVDQAWLGAHLEGCAPCHEFAENLRETIRSLHGIPITADERLVSTTQIRVRQRAIELRRQQERLWVICACSAAVTLCTAVTSAMLWGGLAWVSQQARLSTPVWAIPFALFSLLPGILAGGLLLSQGTHMSDRNGSYRE